MDIWPFLLRGIPDIIENKEVRSCGYIQRTPAAEAPRAGAVVPELYRGSQILHDSAGDRGRSDLYQGRDRLHPYFYHPLRQGYRSGVAHA